MKINLVLLALLIAVVSGNNSIKARFLNKVGDFKDGLHAHQEATIAAIMKKKGIEVGTDPEWDEKIAVVRKPRRGAETHNSLKARFLNKVSDFKDALHGLKKATIAAVKKKKGIEVETDPEWDEKIAPPTTKCHTVFDEVWQEECGTKFNNTCRIETKPVCTTIWAKECTPEPQESCTWVMENKCKTISVPRCTVDWEKRCTTDPICTTVQRKVCADGEKDVCVEHVDKVCTMTSVKVCRKVAMQEKVETDPEWDEKIAVVSGHNSIKSRFLNKVGDFNDALHGLKKAKIAAVKKKKGIEVETDPEGHKAKRHAPALKVKYVKSCEDEPRQTCKKLPRKICHKETVPVCTQEPKESCVEKETCKSWPKKNCEMIHKEMCWPFPTKKCTEITTNVCRNVDRQKCVDKTHEICEAIPIKDCKKKMVKKPRQVCIPLPTIRTQEDW